MFVEEFYIFEEHDPVEAMAAHSAVQLRPRQLDAHAAYNKWIKTVGRRPLIVKATGTGKALVIATLPFRRMLVLAHRDRLCNQLYETIRWARPYLKVGMEKAEYSASRFDDVVVSSIQTLGARRRKRNEAGEEEEVFEITRRLTKWDKNHFDLIVIDEAHHALGNGYLRILQHFNAGAPDGPILCGFTATPFRGDGRPLSNLFDDHNGQVAYKYTLEDATDEGWLCDLEYRRIRTGVDISDLNPTEEDLNPTELSNKINVDLRNSTIISAVEKYADHRRTILVFAADIAHADKLCTQFVERGHNAEIVHYKIPKEEQADIFKRFESGTTRILVNVGIATEGVDVPTTDCLVLARPTRSLVLLSQMLGRGTRNLCPHCTSTHFSVRSTRPFVWFCNSCKQPWGEPERKTCLVLDFVDLVGQLDIRSAMELFDAREVDLLGQPIREALPVLREADSMGITTTPDDTIEQIRERVERLRGVADKTIYVETQAEAIDLFKSIERAPVDQHSIFPWQKLGKEKFLLFGPRGEKIGVWKNDLGEWWIGKVGHGKQKIGIRPKAPWGQVDKAVKRYLREPIAVSRDWSIPGWRIIHSNVKWRNNKPTDKDKADLRRVGVRTIPPGINRGAIKDMINLINYNANAKKTI